MNGAVQAVHPDYRDGYLVARRNSKVPNMYFFFVADSALPRTLRIYLR